MDARPDRRYPAVVLQAGKDYIAAHGGQVESQLFDSIPIVKGGAVVAVRTDEAEHLTVTVLGWRYRFDRLTPPALNQLVQQAMEVAVPYYAGNVARAGATIDGRRIEAAALRVVLDILRVYNLWKSSHWFCRWKRLQVKESHLRSVRARDQILFYAEDAFGGDYPRVAAALTGLSLDQFTKWEAARRKFWSMW
jgi:hypothetical protein